METQIYIIIAISIFLVIREGFQQRDILTPSKAVSNSWHSFGFIVRLLITGLAFQVSNWYFTILIAFILFPIYNIACALGRKQKWYYLSKIGIDGIIRKCLPFINFDK